jgi:CDGSH-type Zn-finger protein/uncharacterized Fe-S cluster protein YjdI
MDEHKVDLYPGEKVDVQWDGRLCIHMGECGYAKGDLFVAGRQPWCQPDLVSLQDTIDVVKRCPSGALTYIVKDGGEAETPAAENTVQVVYNGPLFLQGDLDIDLASPDMPGVRYRAALCRCGQSKTKPFCDNSHIESGFSDYAAVGETGEGFEHPGGKLKVTCLKDGPFLLEGNVAIVAGSGRHAWQGTQVALCRCGQSKNKPFCDGSHSEAGFSSG